jgi:hypothetical protein
MVLFVIWQQTKPWPNEKGQNDKQHHGQMTKDRMTNNTMAK